MGVAVIVLLTAILAMTCISFGVLLTINEHLADLKAYLLTLIKLLRQQQD